MSAAFLSFWLFCFPVEQVGCSQTYHIPDEWRHWKKQRQWHWSVFTNSAKSCSKNEHGNFEDEKYDIFRNSSLFVLVPHSITPNLHFRFHIHILNPFLLLPFGRHEFPFLFFIFYVFWILFWTFWRSLKMWLNKRNMSKSLFASSGQVK